MTKWFLRVLTIEGVVVDYTFNNYLDVILYVRDCGYDDTVIHITRITTDE